VSDLHVTQRESAEFRFSRKEVLAKLGVDLADSFYATKDGYGLDAELVIHISSEKIAKYRE
jgi:hypothetical protein